MFEIRSQKDFASGLLFMAFGLFFAIGALNYPQGTAARMGSGYFPLMLGILLTALGAACALRSLGSRSGPRDRVGGIAVKPLLFVLGSCAVFGVALPALGFIPATMLLIVGVAYAGDEFRWREVLALAAAIAIGGYFVFVRAMGMLIPAFNI